MENNQQFDFIFVVLTYRNSNDLKEFLISTKDKIKDSYKVIVVNSYYDDESRDEFCNIANNNSCDFLNVENYNGLRKLDKILRKDNESDIIKIQ